MGETERSEKSTNAPGKPALSDFRLSPVLFCSERVGAGSHSTGELVEYVNYASYGQTENDYRGAATTGDVVNARWKSFREWYRFTGNEDDAEVGLSYHGARYYSPSLKRFISADPVTVHEAGSDINPYSYGNGNPTMFVDPNGEFAWWIGALVSTAIYVYYNGIDVTSRNWWTGLAVAVAAGAVSGGVASGVSTAMGASVGASVAGTAAGATVIGGVSGAAGGVAGYAAGAWLNAALGGGGGLSLTEVVSGAVTGAISGGVGGGAGAGPGAAAGAVMGTSAGLGMGWAATGQAPTAENIGISLGNALGGAIASEHLSTANQAEATRETEGRANGDGLLRYDSPKTSGRSGGADETRGGGDAGGLLRETGDGSYRVSDVFMRLYGTEFRETFGYDPAKARIELVSLPSAIEPAFTLGDTVYIDRTWWTSESVRVTQAQLLVHEMVHVVQFSLSSSEAILLWRRTVETGQYGPRGQYEISPALAQITDLRALNVLDIRFSLESIARHVELQMVLDRPGGGTR